MVPNQSHRDLGLIRKIDRLKDRFEVANGIGDWEGTIEIFTLDIND
jgi:hypothetical protein